MGIWDRQYMKGPQQFGFGGFRSRQPWSITTTLIAINVAAFLIQGMAGSSVLGYWIRKWLYNSPVMVMEHFCIWQPLTSAFLHGGGWHLIFNMLFLFFFGRQLERLYGRVDFLWFYLLACTVGGFAYAVGGYYYTGMIPSVGASSGVMGVVVLFALFYPHQPIYIYFLIPVPIWILAVFYVLGDLAGFLGGSMGGVANAAHLGGALVGLGFRYYDLRWTTIRNAFGRSSQPRRPRRERRASRRPAEPTIVKFPERGPSAGASARETVPDADRQRMDDILSRISRNGMDSLSEEDKDFMADMSRKLRDR